jgi:D-serine deaminase-like pyridoxal phosphate-dependent protein
MPLYLDQLETPAAVVDLDRLALNLDRMSAYCAVHGLRLRPHVKTHKAPRIAADQLRLGAAGLTVATVREAEVMSELTDDLLLAYPLAQTTALRRFTNIAPSVRLSVALDSREAAERLNAAAAEIGRAVHVLVELDVGMRRTGVADLGGSPRRRRARPWPPSRGTSRPRSRRWPAPAIRPRW